ncbi:hypothetical protein [Sphingosinicella sp. BN140058]|uniref:hypothetical protein n=1 Tax=Sphingosinicella sp. BN140058 TaxID=1892855 RepID=UPI0010134375|nr:hypothetical protein [Sphingosinicella sp. BN140058]QAY78937.1 hypothetical protein ETR14_22140 [Sphingosinicella sp. BN140058]
MRVTRSLLLVGLLVACKADVTHPTICEMGNRFQGWQGTKVEFVAMFTGGSMHSPPLVVDTRCWRGIPGATSNLPAAVRQALENADMFNTFGVVTGRIYYRDADDRSWLDILEVRRIKVVKPLSTADEEALFAKMAGEKNAYHPDAQ